MTGAADRRWLIRLAMLAALVLGAGLGGPVGTVSDALAQSSVRPPAPTNPDFVGGQVPGSSVRDTSDAEMWRAIRQGIRGSVTIPDRNAAQLVQSEGDNWRAVREGPLVYWGVWVLGGMVALLALFYLLRGRIRVEHGLSGRTITRFGFVERMAHWLLAVSFIILALTGLNITFGRLAVMPLIGKEAFAAITLWGKYLHNYVAFAFMLGLAMVLVLWIASNIPNRHDLVWLAKGGGMFKRGVHPPARKFNAGQKILFWLVILGGVSLSLSGLALMFPFEMALFSKTFAALNWLGLNLPTDLAPIHEMQYAALWHAIMALFMIAVILAHIYIGTIGMEGAFDAMGSGEVDVNWAKEHHSLWADEVLAAAPKRRARPAPAKTAPAE